MTIDKPIWMQELEYPARIDRILLELLPVTPGVALPASGALVVTQRAAGTNLSVDVAPGLAIVAGTSAPDQGSYGVNVTAFENLPLTPAHLTLPRIDRIVLTIRDSNVVGTDDDAILQAIAGIPNVVPVAPSLPDSSISLATVAVDNGVAVVTNADITDTRRPVFVTHTPADFGAVGDNITDDSAALQAFINAGGGDLAYDTTYYCGASLIVPWEFRGCPFRGQGRHDVPGSARASALRFPANTPAFILNAGTDGVGVNSALFCDFAIEWDDPSGTGNTDQVAFLHQELSVPSSTWFHNTFERISIRNAYKGWAVAGSPGQSPNIWDTHWLNILFFDLQSSAFDLIGPVTVGQPINTFRDITLANANGPVVSTGPFFRFAAVEAHMSGLDLEGWFNGIYEGVGGFSVDIQGVHIEHHTIDALTPLPYLFYCANGNLSIRNMSVSGDSAGGLFGITAIANADVGGCITLEDLSLAWNPAVGNCIAAGSGGKYVIGPNFLVPACAGYTVAYNDATLRKITGNDGDRTRTGQIVGTRGDAPTAVAQAQAGASPPAPVVDASSTDVRGLVTFGTGTGSSVGALVTLAFDEFYPVAPVVVLVAANAVTAALGLYINVRNTTAVQIAAINPPADSQPNTAYAFYFAVIG